MLAKSSSTTLFNSNLTSITNNIIIVKLDKTTTGTLTIEVPYNGGGEKVTALLFLLRKLNKILYCIRNKAIYR